mgnify:CR=1 FL=1
MTPTDFKEFIRESTSYEAFMAFFKRNTDAVKAGHEILMNHAGTLPLNWQRSTRVEKTIAISPAFKLRLENMKRQLTWLVITEPWCGDSAQSLPLINKIAVCSNGKIDLKIILRDQHHQLIDAFLTNGARAVPKLIQLNDHFEVMGIWGPRPAEAQQLIIQIKSNPETAPHYKDELHKWYAQNKGQAIEQELAQLLEQTAVIPLNIL